MLPGQATAAWAGRSPALLDANSPAPIAQVVPQRWAEAQATVPHKHQACLTRTSEWQGFKHFPPGYDRQEVALLLPSHSTPPIAQA